MTTTTCDVQGCEFPRETVFLHARRGGVREEHAVCAFHSAALESGEAYEVTEDYEIVINPKDLFDVVDAEWALLDGGTVITLKLGHDGIESQQVKFRFTKAMLENFDRTMKLIAPHL